MNLDQIRPLLNQQLPDTIMTLRAKAAEHAPDAPAREAGFRIYNAADDEAVVRIYDEISWYGINAIDLVAGLDTITSPKMRVEINSPGGDVFDGIAIYNALRNHPSHVTTRIDGIAASIASIIAQAGDTRVMQPASQMMIHNAWGLTVGDTRDHADMAALLEQQDAVLASIYALRAGRDDVEFRDLMNAETWLTAEAAVEAGLADVVQEPPAKSTPEATLRDQISAAVDAAADAVTSAARVAALRADAGKDLSVCNREGLDGLRAQIEQITSLLDIPTPDEPEWSEDALTQLLARREAVYNRSEY